MELAGRKEDVDALAFHFTKAALGVDQNIQVADKAIQCAQRAARAGAASPG